MGNSRRIKLGKTYINVKSGKEFTPIKYEKGKLHPGTWTNHRLSGTFVDENSKRSKGKNLIEKVIEDVNMIK